VRISKDKQVIKTDEILMQELCTGQASALEILYERYFDKLVWFASGFTKDKTQAEDVVQEVFMKIIEQPQMFNASQKFSTWVFTLTANRCKNVLRDTSRQQELVQKQAAPQHAEIHSMHDLNLLKSEIRQGLEQLNDKEKAIFNLRFHQNLPLKDIAQIIQIPEGSVKSGLFHVLKKLSKKLSVFIHE
jgi:RNA polymerase sigma-70 factor (ECF subfamily)